MNAKLRTISVQAGPDEETVVPARAAVVAGLRSAWTSPCLAHLRRVLAFPDVPDDAMARDSLVRDVAEANGLNYERDGRRLFVIPAMPPAPILDVDRAALAPWLCVDAACGAQARSFIARAEQTWDLEESRDDAFRQRQRLEPDESCRAEAAQTGRLHSAFERWARCVLAAIPETYRYAPLAYRVPSRGWLVLRGARGHHFGVVEELRAYDLATGSAYVARIELEHPEDVTVFAGRVSREQAREIAFTLVTARAVTAMRPRSQEEPRPPGLAVTFTGVTYLGPVDRDWHDSGQTQHEWLLFAGEAPAAGQLTWPSSSVAWQRHASELVEIMEVGLERGCAPAALPAEATATLPAAGHPERAAIYTRLAKALATFRCQ